MADEGSGATLTFGTSGTSLDVLTIQASGVSRAAIETTKLATTGGKTFMPGDRYDPGEISVSFQYNPNVRPPFSNAAETITVTYPVPAGSTNGATEASSGFVTQFDAGNCEGDTLMTGSVTIKRTGSITFTNAS
jgi:hypothetical protein